VKTIIGWLSVVALVATAGCQGGPGSSGSGSGSMSSNAVRNRVEATRAIQREKPERVVARAPKVLEKKAPLAQTVEGDRQYLAGEYAKAYESYAKAIRSRNSELDAHDGLSRCAASLGRYDEGCRFYEKMLRTNQDNPWLLYGAARMYLTAGDRQLASSAAYRSLRFNPDLSRSYYLIALMQTTDSMPNFKSATRAFEQALEREPDYGPAYYQLALLNAGTGDSRLRAKTMAWRALETLKPTERDVRYEAQVLAGALCAADGENAKALEVFEQALAEHGPTLYERVDVGLLLWRMGRKDEARAEWQKVIGVYGLAHPTGLLAYRQLYRNDAGNMDQSGFLPKNATPGDYRDLAFNMGQAGATVRSVTVPKELRAAMDEYRTPVFYEKMDLDGDGREESVVVDVRPTQDFGQEWKGENLPHLNKRWRLASPTLYVFTDRFGVVGNYSSHMDHFHHVDAVDFNNDGIKELVLTEFGSGNQMNLVVLAKRDVQYHPVLVFPVVCTNGSSGVLAADLDGDGRRELLTVSGDCPWVEVYRFSDEGTFVECQKDFPQFYRDYVKRNGGLEPSVLASHPEIAERLQRARGYVAEASMAKTGTETPVVKTSGEPTP